MTRQITENSDSGFEQLSHVTAVLTAACNFSCGYCYQDAKTGARMDWPILRRCVDLLCDSESPKVELRFFGGEPLLQFDEIKRAVEYAEKKRPKQKSLIYSISTNGALITDEVAEFLVEHRFETQISFDGIAAAQSLRKNGSFDFLDGLLDRLRERWPFYYEDKLQIGLTLYSTNLPHLADSIDYFLDKDVRYLSLGPLVTPDAAWRPGLVDELDRQFARVYESCLRTYRETGLVPLTLFRKNDSDHRDRDVQAPTCGAERDSALTVDADGQLYGCMVFAGSFQRLPGNGSELLEGTGAGRRGYVHEALRVVERPDAPLFRGKVANYSSYGKCADCRYFDSCRVCPGSIVQSDGHDPNRVPDHQCAFNLVVCKYRERFPRQPTMVERLTGKTRQGFALDDPILREGSAPPA